MLGDLLYRLPADLASYYHNYRIPLCRIWLDFDDRPGMPGSRRRLSVCLQPCS